MTSIAEARHAIDNLKKNAAPSDKAHYDTLSTALGALGQRFEELERRVKQAEGMASAAAGIAAAFPGADAINVADATAMARQLTTEAEQAEFDVGSIADLAKQNWQRR